MLHIPNDITQTKRRKKNGSIVISQNWSTQTINHWNGKKEDETFGETIKFIPNDHLQASVKEWT